MFFKGSRYEKVGNYKFRRADGSEIAIKKKRDITETAGKLIHTVQQGERSDLLAYRYYKDPLKFWKLADANPEMNSEDLLRTPGVKIIVPSNDPD